MQRCDSRVLLWLWLGISLLLRREILMRRRFAILLLILAGMFLSGCCLPHDWQDATCVEPKTCSKCGKTKGKALGHTWIDATCTEPKICSVCGETEGDPLGHDTTPADFEHPETCKRCGETFGSPLAAYDPFLDRFRIPAKLGPAEYSKEEICQMIDDDLTLDEVAERIHTYPDLVQYLHNKDYTAGDGDLHFFYHSRDNSVNRSAQTVFEENKGNCGGGSNLVNYILRGDYDSQGYVYEAHMCGGHVFNYFVKDGQYYFCDLIQIVLDNTGNDFINVDNPLKFAQQYVSTNHRYTRPEEDHYLLLLYIYEWEGNHLPIVSTSTRTAKGYPFCYGIPESIEDTVQILYLEEGYPDPIFVDTPPIDVWPRAAR